MSLVAVCGACGQVTTSDDGCFYADTESARFGAATAHWGIAHATCLPREDYGDGHWDIAWSLYAPELPGTRERLVELFGHIAEKNWARCTDLDVFAMEAATGTGRWRPPLSAPQMTS